MTRINSVRVNPQPVGGSDRASQSSLSSQSSQLLSLLPVGDVVLSSFLTVETHRRNVVTARVVLSGTFVDVGTIPRIQRDALFQIRSAPVLRIIGPDNERLQSILAAWIIAVVHFKCAQRRAKSANLSTGGRLRACSPRFANFGTTMAARMPRMTSTRRSSISVKACHVARWLWSQISDFWF